MLSESTARALARGLELYREGRFWHAHEAWEEAWVAEEGGARRLLHGLIQLAAACHKAFVQRQPAGCASLCEKALDKLDGLPSPCEGVDVARVRGEARAMLAAAKRWQAGELDGLAPALAPRL